MNETGTMYTQSNKSNPWEIKFWKMKNCWGGNYASHAYTVREGGALMVVCAAITLPISGKSRSRILQSIQTQEGSSGVHITLLLLVRLERLHIIPLTPQKTSLVTTIVVVAFKV